MADQLSPIGGGPIGGAIAKEWIEDYKQNHPGDIKAFFFGVNIINQILAQAECVGMRIYFGKTNAGEKKLILTGSKMDGQYLESGIRNDSKRWWHYS